MCTCFVYVLIDTYKNLFIYLYCIELFWFYGDLYKFDNIFNNWVCSFHLYCYSNINNGFDYSITFEYGGLYAQSTCPFQLCQLRVPAGIRRKMFISLLAFTVTVSLPLSIRFPVSLRLFLYLPHSVYLSLSLSFSFSRSHFGLKGHATGIRNGS